MRWYQGYLANICQQIEMGVELTKRRYII